MIKQVLRILLFAVMSSSSSFALADTAVKVHTSKDYKFTYEVLTQQNDVIWGFDFLSDGKIIFTERKGKIKIFDPKAKSSQASVIELHGAPKVWGRGQGGLLDVRVHPTRSDQIYLSYSEPFKNNTSSTAVAIATLKANKLTELKKIFSSVEPINEESHFGSRIEFDGKGHIFVTLGERATRLKVQSLSNHYGKVIRLKEDGSVPEDNPFIKTEGAKPEIWALGIRSPQGLVMHPISGDLWLGDMGPRGGDELNIVKRGANYGWPVVTHGREYWGPKIGEGTSKKGMEDPIVYWVPSISPSGITVYNGNVFSKWNGDIFLGNLSGQHIRRVILKGSKVIGQEELLSNEGIRFRNIRSAPDGYLYFSSDDGKIARILPVPKI